MKKSFGIAAMLLALAACNKIETNVQPVENNEGITITATLAPKTAVTKAISDQTTYIKAEWAVNEHIAILYEVSSTKYVADARITAVDGTTGAGTIQTTTPGLTVTTQPEAQFAIFKFTTKNAAGTATINVKPLTITIGSQDYVITPASATSELFAALPAVSGQTVSFSATDGNKTYTCSKDGISFDEGKYYQSTLKMALNKITWNSFPTSGNENPFTRDGVTLTAQEITWGIGEIIADEEDGTFTSTVGNFTKIEITADYLSSWSGWTSSADKATWTGNASTVTFRSPNELTIGGLSSMVFYFQ